MPNITGPGNTCLICTEPLTDHRFTEAPPAGGAHAWCMALTTVGHEWGVCGCTEPPYLGLSKRDAGIETVRRIRAESDRDTSETPAQQPPKPDII